MAQKVGNLVVEMSANVARLQRDFDKANRQAQGVARKFKSIFKGVGLSMAAGLSVAGLSSVVKSSLNAADAIAKGAAKANIATDTYQELTFALDKFDVSQEMAASGLTAFTKRLGEARSGTGALTTYLGKYDQALLDSLVSVESNEQALNIFMKALGGVKNDADRAALSAAAFSRSAGVGIASALKDGGKALDQWRQKARDFGIVVDADILKKAEDAKDRFATLAQVVQSETIVAMSDLTSVLSSPEFLESLRTAAKLTASLAKGMTMLAVSPQSLFSSFAGDLETLPEQIATASKEIDKFKGRIATLENSGVPEIFGGQIDQLKEKLRWAENNLKRLTKLKEQAAALSTPDGAAGVDSTVLVRGLEGQKTALEAVTKAATDHSAALQKQAEDSQLLAIRAAELYESLKSPRDAFNEGIAELDLLKEAGLIDPATYSAAFNKLGSDFAATVDRVEKSTAEMSEFTKQAFGNMANFAEGFFLDVIKGQFDDLGDSFRNMVQGMLANWASMKFMTAAFGSEFGKGGDLGGLVGSLASSFGGPRALGGPVAAGVPYLVGERGPELIVPSTSGNVVPNNRLAGTSINVPVNVQNGDKALTADMQRSMEATALEVLRRHS